MSKNKVLTAVAGGVVAMAIMVSLAAAQTGENEKKGENGALSAKMSVMINASGRAQLNGTVVSVASTSVVVKSWGGNWTVDTSGPDVKILRRFGGASNLAEFVAGDYVSVLGTVSDSATWTIVAKNVRDMSIQARNASFTGTISNLNGNSFTLSTKGRGNVAVTLAADAKISIVGSTSTGAAALANGMTVGVSGVWDRTQSTVTANRVIGRMPKVKKQENENEHKGSTSTTTSTPAQ